MQLYQTWAGGESSAFLAVAFAEMLPRPENCVTLDPHHRDAWGVPVLCIDCAHRDDEVARVAGERLIPAVVELGGDGQVDGVALRRHVDGRSPGRAGDITSATDGAPASSRTCTWARSTRRPANT